MPSALPDGEPAPPDGSLPAGVLEGAAERAFGVYLHVPFCRVRCGYCDFNTYTATELQGARQEDYLARMLDAVRDAFSLADGAEVTTEANPDSVDREALLRLADAGVTRISLGMQSAVPRVLAVLDRTHDPARIPLVVGWAREAGLAVSLDLIHGAPGETLDDWLESLRAALGLEPDHVSAYALIVEEGTRLAARIRRGELPAPDDDLQAEMYEAADELRGAAGYAWYEVSNWARTPADRSRHNLAYWTGEDWWGVGPGAHSHVGGVRWWNVKHPGAYARRIADGASPAQARERLDAAARVQEELLLRTRIADGYPIERLGDAGRRAVAGLIADGLVDGAEAICGRLVPTLRGRLLADLVVRTLAD